MIALVTCKDYPNLTFEDKLLQKTFRKFGIEAQPQVWDKKDVDWEKYDAIILRSTWDYHRKIQEFQNWLEFLKKKKIKVYNPLSILKWNLNKKYLFDLEKKGVAIIPTFPVFKHNMEKILEGCDWDEWVVKPFFGASSYKIFRFNKNDNLKNIPVDGFFLQKYIQSIKTEGEWSLVFFNKKFSHAVLVKPYSNDFRVDRDHPQRMDPPLFLIKSAEKILRLIPGPLLYARVDMVMEDGKPFLMELELLEPSLYFDNTSAVAFVKAFNDLQDKKSVR